MTVANGLLPEKLQRKNRWKPAKSAWNRMLEFGVTTVEEKGYEDCDTELKMFRAMKS